MSDIPTVTYYAYDGTRYVGQFSGEDSAVLAFISNKGYTTGPKPLASDRDLWVSILGEATAAQEAAQESAEAAEAAQEAVEAELAGLDFSADDRAKIDGIEDGADVTDTANVTAAGALMDSEVASLSGIKTLTVPDSATISAFGAGLVGDVDAAAARATLEMGTAATTASTDYATADQGTAADSAVQPADDAGTLGSGAATDGQVLTADGAGGAGWDDVPGVPSGCILMWSGSVATIPSGWVICDGTNSTPDLTGKFIVHADSDSGGTYEVGDTGGADSVTLTEAQMPSHTHTGSTNTTGAHSHAVNLNNSGSGSFNRAAAAASSSSTNSTSALSGGDHSHTFTTASAGAGDSHENRPPFYALAYIMKT